MSSATRRAELAILTVVLIWGANFAFIKGAVEEIPPLAFAAFRFTVASLILAALVKRIEGGVWWPAGYGWRVVGLGLIGNSAYQALFMLGIARTTAGNSALMIAPTPVLIAVLGAATGVERLTRPVAAGLLLTLTGVALVVAESATGPDRATLVGDMMVIGASLCWSIYTVGVRAAAVPVSALRLTALSMVTGTPVLVLMGLGSAWTFDWSTVTARGWGGTAYATLLGLCAAYIMYNYAVKSLGSSRTGVFLSLIPVVALVMAALLVGERPSAIQMTGAVLIIAGVITARTRGSAAPLRVASGS